ncbi:MAG: glucose 1-dehydrogenase [Roseovarius sp.]|nr:glucose 1-dehydrogenase [Roseovarius sp.]
MKLLEGKSAIVTGAASPRGLGKATARLFSEHGCKVAILDLDPKKSMRAAADIGDRHMGVACDVANRSECDRAVEKVLEAFGKMDILVNNAGITQPLKIMEIDQDGYDAVLNVNLRGTMNMSQAIIPHMRSRKCGALINMSSVSAQRGGGIFGGPHYSAAKAGILGLTKAMARELAVDGIRVNAICPGFIATDITAGMLADQMKKQIIDDIPMGRAGTAADVAGCALFLASELSAYVTGSELDVNGGSLIH